MPSCDILGWRGAAAQGDLAGLVPFNEISLLGGVQTLIDTY